MGVPESDLLAWLQNWYAQQCDGEWEHDHGVRIETLDNPGWYLRMDVGAALHGFEPVSEELPDRWLHARVTDGTLWVACDPHSLGRALALARAALEGG